MATEYIQLRAARAIDMLIKQRNTLKTQYGSVLHCRDFDGVQHCRKWPRLPVQVANYVTAYWRVEIIKSMNAFSSWMMARNLPDTYPKWTVGVLSAEDTDAFWRKLEKVIIELNAYNAVPSAWEVTLEDFTDDVLATIANIVPSFTIPTWMIVVGAGTGVLWFLKKR